MSGPTVRYLRGRERILGRRWSLSEDPETAAEQLADRIGDRRARQWAARLVRALERRRSAA